MDKMRMEEKATFEANEADLTQGIEAGHYGTGHVPTVPSARAGPQNRAS